MMYCLTTDTTNNLMSLVLSTQPLVLPPTPLSSSLRHGCPLCAWLEQHDQLIDPQTLTPVDPVWVAPVHAVVYPTMSTTACVGIGDAEEVARQLQRFTSGYYQVTVAYGHLYVQRVDRIDDDLTWGERRPLSKYLFVDADGLVWWSDVEHPTTVLNESIGRNVDELIEQFQPQQYAHHRQLAPVYWSLVVDHYHEVRKRRRVMATDDELRAFYGRITTNGLELFAKWEFLGHDFDVRWAKNVPLKYQLIRSNLLRNPELPYSWPIHVELTVNPPTGVYQLGGGHGSYLETTTELINGDTVYALFVDLPAERIYRIGLECLALLHEAHYGSQMHHWMHLDPHLDNFLLSTNNSARPEHVVRLGRKTLTLTEPLWLIDYNSAYFPDFPTEFVAADFAYANEQDGWYRRYTTINPAWDFIYFLRHYWWAIATKRPELLQQDEFQQFLYRSLEAIPEQLLLFAGRLDPLDHTDDIQQWFYSLLGHTTREVQSLVVHKAEELLATGQIPEWVRAWFGFHRGVSYIGQRRLVVDTSDGGVNGSIGQFLDTLVD